MRTATECLSHAEECRRLAAIGPRAEDWGHFQEMAQTWELLANLRQSENNRLAETLALAESIASGRGLNFESRLTKAA